jgi:parallel beta-helix repeat protein
MSHIGTPQTGSLKYIVFKDAFDGTIKARNRDTAKIEYSHATDLGSVLNSAFDAMTGGGSILLAAADYTGWATKVTVVNSFTGLIGERGSKIRPPVTYADDLFSIDASDVTFQNIYFDGTAMNNGAGSFINTGNGATQADRLSVINSFMKNSPLHGIYAGFRTNGLYLHNSYIQNFKAPTGHGVYLNSSADHCITASGVGGYGNATNGAGISFNGCSETIVANCEIYVNRIGIQLFDTENLIIDSNLIQENIQQGIYCWNTSATDRENVQISGNRIHNNGTQTANTYDGLYINPTGAGIFQRFVIANNIITDDFPPGSKTQRYGININTLNLIDSVVANNNVAGNISGGINLGDYSASLIVANNAGALNLRVPQLLPLPSSGLKFGAYFANNHASTLGAGMFTSGLSFQGTPTYSNVLAEGRYQRHDTTTTAATTMGLRLTILYTMRGWNPVLRTKFRVTRGTGAPRIWIGFWTDATTNPTGDDALNTKSGVFLGARSTDTNWVAGSNDSVGATTFTNFLPGNTGSPIAIDTGIHIAEVMADDANSRFRIRLDQGRWMNVTADIPAQATAMSPFVMIQNSAAASSLLDIFWLEMTTEK